MPHKKVPNLAKLWREHEKSNNRQEKLVTIKGKNKIGITSLGSIQCMECNEETMIDVERTKFKGNNDKGSFTKGKIAPGRRQI